MYKINVTFKVSRDNEARKIGDTETVTLKVIIPESKLMEALQGSVSSEVIAIQAHLKANWPAFLADLKAGKFPAEMEIGTRPYGTGKRGVRKPTAQEIRDYTAERISKMTPEEIVTLAQTGKFPEDV